MGIFRRQARWPAVGMHSLHSGGPSAHRADMGRPMQTHVGTGYAEESVERSDSSNIMAIPLPHRQCDKHAIDSPTWKWKTSKSSGAIEGGRPRGLLEMPETSIYPRSTRAFEISPSQHARAGYCSPPAKRLAACKQKCPFGKMQRETDALQMIVINIAAAT